jgi:hypothetical protein
MKEIDFNGFVIYKIYTNGNIVVNHVIKGNDANSFNEAIKTIYAKWNRRFNNVKDIILLTLPIVKPYTIENPIFRASTIGTDNEFDRDSFQLKYYGV